MKTFLTAAALALTLAGTAQAQNMFATMEGTQSDNASVITIDPLTATADGFVAIYDYHAATVGKLLGVASVREGANFETRVTLGFPVQNDVIAFLFVGDDFTDPSTAVDSVEIEIED